MLPDSRTFSLTPAGRAYLRFLLAYNSNDPKKIRAYIADKFAPEFLAQHPVEELTQWCLEAYKVTGDMQIHKVYFSEDYYVIIIAITGSGVRYLEKMKIMTESPHKIIEYFRENA